MHVRNYSNSHSKREIPPIALSLLGSPGLFEMHVTNYVIVTQERDSTHHPKLVRVIWSLKCNVTIEHGEEISLKIEATSSLQWENPS
jgi:hypothetical protein